MTISGSQRAWEKSRKRKKKRDKDRLATSLLYEKFLIDEFSPSLMEQVDETEGAQRSDPYYDSSQLLFITGQDTSRIRGKSNNYKLR